MTEEQYARIKDRLPVQRSNGRLTNLQVLSAILYVAKQGCEWRGLPFFPDDEATHTPTENPNRRSQKTFWTVDAVTDFVTIARYF